MADQSGEAPAQAKYDLLSPAFFADPHPVLHQMRAEDPVYWHPLLNFWVLTRYEDVQTITRDPRFSAERFMHLATGVSDAMKPKVDECLHFFSHWMASRDPPRHTVLRALVAKAFSPQMVEGLRPMIINMVDEMLDAVEDIGQMDVVRDLAFPLPAMVIAKMLGVERDKMDEFKTWTNDIFALLGSGVATDEAVESCHRGIASMRSYFFTLIAERRNKPTDDLLSRLVHVEEQGTVLNEEELVSNCALLLIAGHETTTHLIGNAVLALLRNPLEMRKLREDPTLIEGAVEEFLRYDGAAVMLSRRATEDLELGGVKIKANDVVVGFLHGANRDPALFPDPDRLDITRKGAKSLAFGHGVHYCLGAALARLEAQVALTELIGRLKGLRLVFESPQWIPTLAIHGLASLPVMFERPVDERPSYEAARGWDGPVSIRVPLSTRAPVSVPPPPVSVRMPRM